MYHLLCFYHDDLSRNNIVDACLSNVSIEISRDMENITWITSVCGNCTTSLNEFETLMKMNGLWDCLTESQLILASSAFRKKPFYKIDNRIIQQAMNLKETLSPIWLTKIYANQFLTGQNQFDYYQEHGKITCKTMVELLDYPDDTIRKYAMWALAQEAGGNLIALEPYISVPEALQLEPGVRKWYFVKVFQDKGFLESNPDFVQEIQKSLSNISVTEKEGILIGCEKLGYSKILSPLVCEWEESNCDGNEALVLRLMQYIARHADEDEDFYEIIKSALRNLRTIQESEIRTFLTTFMQTERGRNLMSKGTQTINFNATVGNVNIVQGDMINNADTGTLIKRIEQLEISTQEYDDFNNERFDELTAHLDYELSDIKKRFLVRK